jgi:hypothetical protein
MRQMIQASANLDELEDQICPDGSGSEMAQEIKKKVLPEKIPGGEGVFEREKPEKVNVTDPESRLMKGNQKAIRPTYNRQIAVDDKKRVIVAADVI